MQAYWAGLLRRPGKMEAGKQLVVDGCHHRQGGFEAAMLIKTLSSPGLPSFGTATDTLEKP